MAEKALARIRRFKIEDIKYKVSLLGEVKEGMGDQLGREATWPARHRETLSRGDRANHPRSVYHPSEIRHSEIGRISPQLNRVQKNI